MLTITTDYLLAFLLVLARVAGVFALAPLPGTRLVPPTAKIVLSLLLAGLLAPLARVGSLDAPGWTTLAVWAVREAGFGLAVALALQLLNEMLGLAAQLLGFQAGYSYINAVDPSTQVDATILNILLTLVGGLLFFAFDLHLHVVRALALSWERFPVGEFRIEPQPALRLVRLGAAVFETAVRLAFPVVALLLLLDLALTLLSYVNARMQLLTLSFTVKILVALGSLYVILLLVPRLYHQLAGQVFGAIRLLGGR